MEKIQEHKNLPNLRVLLPLLAFFLFCRLLYVSSAFLAISIAILLILFDTKLSKERLKVNEREKCLAGVKKIQYFKEREKEREMEINKTETNFQIEITKKCPQIHFVVFSFVKSSVKAAEKTFF